MTLIIIRTFKSVASLWLQSVHTDSDFQSKLKLLSMRGDNLRQHERQLSWVQHYTNELRLPLAVNTAELMWSADTVQYSIRFQCERKVHVKRWEVHQQASLLSVSLKSGTVCNCVYPCVIKCSLSKAAMTLTSLSHCLKKVHLTLITHTHTLIWLKLDWSHHVGQ